MALSVVSININGLRDRDKRAGLVQWLHSLSSLPDVVCLQECHCVSEVLFWFPSTGLLCAVSPGSNHSCGVLCCFVHLFLSFALHPMVRAILFSVSFRIVAKFSVLHVCMLLIVIRSGKNFLTMFVSRWIPLCLQF